MNGVGSTAGRLTRIAATAALAAAASVALVVTAGPAAAAPPDGTFQSLTLINGWSVYPGARTPAVDRSNGIVHLKGMILTSAQNAHPFVIPQHWRPDRRLIIAAGMCAGRYGRLIIAPTGQVTVGSPYGWNTPSCLTSLEGISYVQDGSATRPISLLNGWTPVNSSSGAAYSVSGALVHLTGDLTTSGSPASPFTVPAPPAQNVFLPIGTCNGDVGMLEILPNGTTNLIGVVPTVEYQCLVSLDGVSYWAASLNPQFAPITLQNGWQSGPAGTGPTRWFFDTAMDTAALGGGMADGDAPSPTSPYVATGATIPSGRIQLLAATCGHVGQLEIVPNGVTTVWPPDIDGWPAARCMTSLDGIQYALNQQG